MIRKLRTRSRTASPRTRYRINWPLLIATMAGLLVLAVGLYFWREFQLQKIAVAFKDRAEALGREAQWEPAAGYLHRYVRMRPDDGEARIRLAEMYDKSLTDNRVNPRAVELYYQALAVAPPAEQPRLRERTVDLLLALGRFVEAEQVAQDLLATEPEGPRATRCLALALHGLFRSGELGGRRDRVRHAMEEASRQGDSPAWYRVCAVGEALERAAAANPADVELATLLARTLREDPELLSDQQLEKPAFATRRARETSANRLMDRLVEAASDSPDGYLARHLYRQQYELPGAENDLQAAIQRGAENDRVLTIAAGFYERRAALAKNEGRPDEEVAALIAQARSFYRQLADSSDESQLVAQLGVANLLAEEGRLAEAIEQLESAGRQFDRPNERLLLRIAELQVAHGQFEAAVENLDVLEDLANDREVTRVSQRLNPLDQLRKLLRAVVLIEQNEPLRAIAEARPLAAAGDSELNVPRRARNVMARAYSQLGQWDRAAGAYEQIVRDEPDADRERLLAAANWMEADMPERAIPHYARLAQAAPRRDIRYDLAVALFSAQRKLPPAERDWNRFEALLEELQTGTRTASDTSAPNAALPAEDAGEDNPLPAWRPALLAASYQHARGQESTSSDEREQARQAALNILREVEDQAEPGQAAAWRELALRYEQLGEPSEADRALARARELEPHSSDWFVLAARLHSGRGDNQEARKVLREGLQAVASTRREPLQLALVKLERQAGDYAGAETALRSLDGDEEEDVRRLSLRADLALERGDLETAEQIENRLGELETDSGVTWRVIRVRRLLTKIREARLDRPTEHEDFRQLLRDESYLLAQRPRWSTAHVLSARRAELAGQSAEALEAYRRAVELGDRRTNVLGPLIELLNRQGDYEQAERYLQMAHSAIEQSDSLSVQAIISSLGRQDATAALQLAERRARNSPDNAAAQAWYGRVLSLKGNVSEATAAFRAAARTDPADVGNWNLLLGHYLRNGQADQARSLLNEMDQRAELAPVELALTKARGYRALGDNRQAEACFRQATQLDPDNVRAWKQMAGFYEQVDLAAAIDALRQVLRLDAGDGEARRGLAALLARRGRSGDWSAALELLGEREDAEHDSLDLRLRGLLLVRRSRAPAVEPDEQADLMEQLDEIRQQLEAQSYIADGDRLLLARIYERQSQLAPDEETRRRQQDELKRLLRSLCRKTDPQPEHLRTFIQFLLADGEGLREAGKWQETLERIAPDDSRTLDLRVRLLKAEGQGDRIAAVLRQFARRLGERLEEPARRVQLYLSVAQIANRAEMPGVAETWARQAMQLEPRAYRAVVQTLVAQGKSRAAVELCREACRRTMSAEDARTLATTLAEVQAEGELLRGSEPLLNEVLVAQPADSGLLVSVANLYFIRRRTEGAITLYERALQLDPRNALALNNLATLLAEQPGRGEEAMRYVERAMELFGRSPALLDTKATILLHEGREKEAVVLLREATAGDQVDPRYLLHLATAYYRTRQTESARDALQRAIEGNIQETLLTEQDARQLQELEQNLNGPATAGRS